MTNSWKSNIIVASDFKYRDIAKFTTGSVVVVGMRRLGKTEYLKYRFSLLEDKESIIYINLDAMRLSDIDFSDHSSVKFIEFRDALYFLLKDMNIKTLFIDELQKLGIWGRFLKGIIDEFSNLTIIASGSDALALKNETEKGLGRFKLIFVGPVTYKEFLKMDYKKGNNDMDTLFDHLDNWSWPSAEMNQIEESYFQIYEKQISESNFSSKNVNAVLRTFSVLPGAGVSYNSISTQLKETSDQKPTHTQVKEISNFLINSEIVFSIDGISSIEKPSASFNPKYYPFNWNLYKAFSIKKSYKDLNEIDNPRKGYVFENYVLSNIFSSLHTPYERNNIYFGNGINECDLIWKDIKYEIKSFDVLYSDDMRKYIEKAKKTSSIIIHTGKSIDFERVKLINVAEFLRSL